MKFKDTKMEYGFFSKLIHWVMALAILGMFVLGLWMRTLGYYDSLYRTAPHIHESIGLILFALLLFRFTWRLTNPKLDDSHIRPLERLLSHLTHKLLYLLMALIMISGFLISTADGVSVRIFDWFAVPAMVSAQGQEDTAGLIHEILSYTVIGFALLHGLAAIKHHFIDKDDILRRMLPRFSHNPKTD